MSLKDELPSRSRCALAGGRAALMMPDVRQIAEHLYPFVTDLSGHEWCKPYILAIRQRTPGGSVSAELDRRQGDFEGDVHA
jgi:hypothetical protein